MVELGFLVIFVLSKKILLLLTLFPKTKLNRTFAMMNTCIIGRLTQNQIDAEFAEESTLPVVSALSKLPIVSIHLCVAVYPIFQFEPVYCISLVVERTLKKYIVFMFGDKNRTNSSKECANRNEKYFRAVKKTVRFTLNTFLKYRAKNSHDMV